MARARYVPEDKVAQHPEGTAGPPPILEVEWTVGLPSDLHLERQPRYLIGRQAFVGEATT
jgi:hypothetical protein